jgi:hypothetical protein
MASHSAGVQTPSAAHATGVIKIGGHGIFIEIEIRAVIFVTAPKSVWSGIKT